MSCVTTWANDAGSEVKLSADIGPRPVTEALAAFGRQTGLQLIYVSTIAETQQSKGARAGQTASEALKQLLDGTGLTFEFLNARTVRVFPAPTVVPTAMLSAAVPVRAMRQSSAPETLGLEEVTVSARRREEEQGKVPISMVVWSADDLKVSGVNSIDQIAYMTPSVQLDTYGEIGGSLTNITIRGVSDRSASIVGLYFDDTPIPPAFGFSFLRSFPFPFDVARVEVLRGPQLQLFGEGNQSGAVRYVSNQPSLSDFTGSTQGELATTERGDMSYEAGAAAGGAIVRDVLGFRVSAWGRHDGGFVDRIDPLTGATVDRNANHLSSEFFRGALTFAPGDAVRITPALSYSSFDRHDSAFFTTGFSNVEAGQLRNGVLLRQPNGDAFYLASLKVTATLGSVDLSAVSSYFHRMATVVLDQTANFDWGSPLGPGYPVAYDNAVADQIELRQAMFMQELRVASFDPRAVFSWEAGAFYSVEHMRYEEHFAGPAEIAAALGLPPGPVDLENTALESQTRFATFAELTLRITNRLTLSANLHNERTQYDAVTELPPVAQSAGADSALLPRFALSYQAGERNLLYLTAAKGYGSGGFWAYFVPCTGEAPLPINTETLWSYEAGTKNGLVDGRLQLDASVFHILWNNHQGWPGSATYSQCTAVYLGNPGAAASNGFDLESQALLGTNLKLSLALAYSDARYRGALAGNGANFTRPGEAVGTLPHVVAPWNITASVDYSRVLSAGLRTDLRIEDIFRRRNPGPFQDDDPTSVNYNPNNRPDPSTNLVNLRATLRWASYDAALFVNNALDSQPTILRSNEGTGLPFFFATTFRPRTVGLSASWHF